MLVFDATPLIYLAKAGVLEKVEDIQERKVIPSGVHQEVVAEGQEKGEKDSVTVKEAIRKDIFEVTEIEPNKFYRKLSNNSRLSDADVQVLVLAKEEGGTAIIDEEYGRTVAESEGIESRGTVYLLFRLLKDGTMDGKEIRETINRMIESGWYCSTDLYAEILKEIEKLEE